MPSPLVLPITKVSQLVKNKALNVTELYSMCLQRINKIKDLNAFITVTENIGSEQSAFVQKCITEEINVSVLGGIPIAFKDNFSTKDVQTTCASKMLSNYIAPYDATVVEKLCSKGAVMMGKTNLDEFAMGSATVSSYFGPVRNPWRSGLKPQTKETIPSFYDGRHDVKPFVGPELLSPRFAFHQDCRPGHPQGCSLDLITHFPKSAFGMTLAEAEG
ncbi:glutamyl-tRNA(Gln) amidotransferase subunit A, mitochondrial [Caerostris extrusa]|uniref:Glutamyl-tRNA(Gln) amidotransferase subunit A, mitochondrial n=1 Tax=Caerostris extrusa TaxID=172846 RepID=A0AAV4Q4H4_CAEEX|nr:glutamyl-tRNA(Gln) amidotransferase subunit A, mitochondrial [Caerostris extrusa]